MTFTETNYTLIAEKEKEKRILAVEKIPEIKEIALKILIEDKKMWESKNLQQFGMERNILLSKVLKEIKINGQLFDLSIEELEYEQKIIPIIQEHLKRYIIFII